MAVTSCVKDASSPLSSLGSVTRAEVTYHVPGDGPPHQQITDPDRLGVLRAAARRTGAWHAVFDTPPAGIARAAFYRDSIFLGVLSVGPDFIGASDGVVARFRKPASAEADSVYVAICLPPKP